MAGDRVLKVVVLGDASSLQGTFKKTEGATQGLDTGMGKLHGTVARAGTALGGMALSSKVRDGLQEAGTAARNFQDQISGASSASGVSMDVLSAKAKSFEFIPPSVAAQGLKDLSLIQQGMGVTGQQSLDMSSKLLTVAQAMSVVAGVDVATVIEGIAAASRGEFDQIQKLVPAMTSQAIEQRALADTGKTQAAALTEAEKSQAALNIVVDEGNRFLPQLAANSDNAAAAHKRNEKETDAARIAMGDKMLPAMEKLSSVTSTLFGWFSKLPGPVQTVALGIVVLGGVLAPLLIAGSSLIGIFSGIGGSGAVAAAGTTAAGTGAAAGSTGFFALAAGVWAAMAPFLPLILAVTAVIAVGYLLVRNWDTIRAVAGAVFGFLGNLIGTVVGAIIGFFGNLIGGVVDFVQKWGVLLLGPIGFIWMFRDQIWGVIQAVVGFFGNLLGNIVGFVQQWGVLLLGPIGFIIKFRDEIWGAIQAVIGFFGGLIGSVAGAMGGFVGAIAGRIGEAVGWFAGLPGRILGGLGDIGGALFGMGKDLIQGLINGVINMGGAVKNALLNLLPGPLKSLAGALGLTSPSRLMRDKFGKPIGQGLALGIWDTASLVRAAMAGLGDTVASSPLTAADLTGATGRLAPFPASGAIAAAGAAQGTRQGPILNVEHMDVHTEADMDVLGKRLAFAVDAAGL